LVVPRKHLARAVRSFVGCMDVSAAEAQYSSLGRHGYHPRQLLGVWVYASLVGMHHSTRVARACRTDAAFWLLCGGHAPSGATLRRFRQRNRVLFEEAMVQTVREAHALGLLDTSDLAVDSVRVRAHASTKAVRTVVRSRKRLAELSVVDVSGLSAEARGRHEEKVVRHQAAVAECEARGRSNLVLTNPSAALMKFPYGASAPGHRVTVTAAGKSLRLVVGVLVDSDGNDYGKLEPAVRHAQGILGRAGVGGAGKLGVAADAGFLSEADLSFATGNEAWVDVFLPEPEPGDASPGKYFGRGRFRIDADQRAFCPAGKPMKGPCTDTHVGRLKWVGVGCGECPLKRQCTPGRERALTADLELERLRQRMRERMAQPGARERYNRRIATVEPVFAYIEDVMLFRRASSRHAETIVAEVLLKLLAHNIARLIARRPSLCIWIQIRF